MTVPKRMLEDWLKAYLVYTYPTEPPELYHLWTGISTVAGVLRRRSWVNFSHFNLYPNHYVVLTGPAGAMKSSSARIGRELLGLVPGTRFSVDSTSREKLILDLSQSLVDDQSAMTAFCSEFGSFFSTSGAEMAVFLTDIYECPLEWSHSSKSGGTQTIKLPCLNLLAGTTPESIQKALPIQSIGMGLTSRILFVCADLPRERPWRTRKTPEQKQLELMLVNDLQVISMMSGEFNFTPEADEAYDKWNRVYKQDPYKDCQDTRLRAYYARKHTHILKLCMVISASQRSSMVMTMQDLEDAFGILAQVEGPMSRAFAGVGDSVLAAPYEFVIELLEHATAPMGYEVIRDILKRDVRREELDEILETLSITKAVVKELAPNGMARYYIQGTAADPKKQDRAES